MNKNKIAILVNNMGGGGAERTVANLLHFLKDDYEAHLILLGNRIDYELPDNQIIKYIDNENSKRTGFMKIFKIPLISRRLVGYCKENEIPLVLSFLTRSNFVSCLAKKLGLRSKVLISEQAYTPMVYKGGTISSRTANFLISRLYPFADLILPNSKGTRDSLISDYNVENEYFIIKNPTNIAEIQSKMLEPVDDVNFEKFTFINVAGFRVQKNHHLLIDAFHALNQEDAQLLLIGKGEEYETIRQKVNDYGLNDQVIFIGHSDNPFKYLAKANCFVLSSDFEGFPNVLIEALACEIPIISTDCRTGPRELLSPNSDYRAFIENGFEIADYGILVPVDDKEMLAQMMMEVMVNIKLLNKYKTISSKKASEFDNTAVIGELKKVIDGYMDATIDGHAEMLQH